MTTAEERAREILAEVIAASTRMQIRATPIDTDPRLDPITSALTRARDEALEEAAKVARTNVLLTSEELATAIRALKTKEDV